MDTKFNNNKHNLNKINIFNNKFNDKQLKICPLLVSCGFKHKLIQQIIFMTLIKLNKNACKLQQI